MSKLVNPQTEGHFALRGLNFFVESDKESQNPESPELPISIDLKSIDAIYNPEYDALC